MESLIFLTGDGSNVLACPLTRRLDRDGRSHSRRRPESIRTVGISEVACS
jgi:hypothetical protein